MYIHTIIDIGGGSGAPPRRAGRPARHRRPQQRGRPPRGYCDYLRNKHKIVIIVYV